MILQSKYSKIDPLAYDVPYLIPAQQCCLNVLLCNYNDVYFLDGTLAIYKGKIFMIYNIVSIFDEWHLTMLTYQYIIQQSHLSRLIARE
jgi:hypothetical protein